MNSKNQTQQRALQLAAQLTAPRPMRRGWVGERRMKCGKKNCPCQQDPKARHGPYFTLTTPGRAKAKTQSVYLSPPAAAIARQQIEARKEFRQNLEELMRAAEQWADEELEAAQSAGAEKKGCKKPSPRKSKRR